jgi:hypothetical protein
MVRFREPAARKTFSKTNCKGLSNEQWSKYMVGVTSDSDILAAE